MSMTPEALANMARVSASVDMQWVNNMDTQRAIDKTVRNNQNAMSSQRTFYESEIARLSGIIERTEMTVTLEVGRVLSEKLLVERDLDLAKRDLALVKKDLIELNGKLKIMELDHEHHLNVLNTEVELTEADKVFLESEKRDLEVEKTALKQIDVERASQVRDTNRLLSVAKMSNYVYATQMDELVDTLKAEAAAGEVLSPDSIDRAKQKVQQNSEAALTPLLAAIEKKLRVRKSLTPEGESFMEKAEAHPLAINMSDMMKRLKVDLLAYSTQQIVTGTTLLDEREVKKAEIKRIRDEKMREQNERMSGLKSRAGL